MSHDDPEKKPPPAPPARPSEPEPAPSSEAAAPSEAEPGGPPRVDAGRTVRLDPDQVDAAAAERAHAEQTDSGATVRLDPEHADAGATVRVDPEPPDPAATVRMERDDRPAQPAPTPPAARGSEDATVRWSAEEVARLAQAEADAADAAEADDDPLIGTLIRNKWRVLKRLGAGSFGTVYKVEDVKGGWVEALKILGVDRLTGAEADEMRARFLREAQIMKRLGTESQHIVGLATYEEDIEAGLVYFLMEYVEGRSLAAVLREEGPFPVERTLRIAKQVCEALTAAHEGAEPVVHRDLKLENLMLTKDRAGAEIVKVLDFGIAKIAEKDADSRLTQVGTLGTPGFAAPEQLRAEGVDGRTDLFAFGVILYALLTGRDPWLGNLAHEPTHQIYELMVATDRGEVRPMSEAGVAISPAMVNVIMKLLRRDPAHRFQSARDLLDMLERIEAGTAQTDASSLRVLTAEPGVQVEVRSGREVVASGKTPLVASGVPAGTYTIVVRDPLFAETDTTVILGPGVMEDVTLVTSRRAEQSRERAAPGSRRRRRGRVRIVVALMIALGLAGFAYARPWGRTLDEQRLMSLIERGQVTDAWITEGGVEGGVIVAPPVLAEALPSLADFRTRYFVPLDEGQVPELVDRLGAAGVSVDTSWEVRRLTDLAVAAQSRSRYYGVSGDDVRSYALRLAELDPESTEAASLLHKVGEHMAWDAAAALEQGAGERVDRLLEDCLDLVPQHPRCLEVAESR